MASYVKALSYYRMCNNIDTTPIFPPDSSNELCERLTSDEHLDGLLGCSKPNKFYC